MRETKEQKMARLERQLAEKSNELKAEKANHREAIKGYKKEIDTLKKQYESIYNEKETNISKLQNQVSELKNTLEIRNSKYNSLWEERCRFYKSNDELRNANFKMMRMLKAPDERRAMITEKQHDRYRAFLEHRLYDSDTLPLFDPQTLLIRFDPNIGYELSTYQMDKMYYYACRNDEYEKDLKEWLSKRSYFLTEEDVILLDKLGRKHLPSYMDFFDKCIV